MTIVLIEANVPWKVIRAKSGNWIGICDPLALTIQSETWAHLMEDIGLGLNSMLKDLFESRDLERFLRERGWRSAVPIPSRPDDVQFDVPFTATRTEDRDSQVSIH